MDFPMWNRFSVLAAKVEVYKKGEHLCTFDTIVGLVSILTGYKPNKFALTEDTRKVRKGDSSIL